MINIGVIGAGSISLAHLDGYAQNKDCKVVAIADLNVELAKKRATDYGIEKVYSDYKDILKDEEIDAVSIVTPTFTHKGIVIEALESGKDVLCEKPPALNAEETAEMVEVVRKSGKLLMFAFVCRFKSAIQYLKEYMDAGRMGRIISASAVRLQRCNSMGGWFANKSKSGGGPLIDQAIHELDAVLYVMGYPKVQNILGFTSDACKDLPSKVKGYKRGWISADTNRYEQDVENVASAFITLENGGCIHVSTSTVLHTVTEGRYIEFCGEKAGARLDIYDGGFKVTTLDTHDGYFRESNPVIDANNAYHAEINHFIDCVMNGTECICKPDDAVALMKVIDGIYQSAETRSVI